MKFLIICNCASGLIDFRGMLIQELIQKGNAVSAVIPTTDDEHEMEAEHGLKHLHCRLIRIPMERRGMNPLKDYALLQSYKRIIQQESPDMVITYTIKPNAYGGIACSMCRVPYAANITGLGTAFQGDGILRRFVTVLYKIALKKAKVVFFENVENLQLFVDRGIVKAEQTRLLNGAGVNLEHFKVQEYPEGDAVKFLFVGRIMQEKGVDELFAAMRKLRKEGVNCSLDVLGEYEEDYSEAIKKCEAEGWLRYHGYQNDVRPFIAAAHCFVLPSWHEGMANTNLECASSGRPVITSNIHGCLEAVEDGVSGYLCQKQDAESLYQKMKQFASLSYEQRKAMGLAGRKRMEMLFDKKAVVERTVQSL